MRVHGGGDDGKGRSASRLVQLLVSERVLARLGESGRNGGMKLDCTKNEVRRSSFGATKRNKKTKRNWRNNNNNKTDVRIGSDGQQGGCRGTRSPRGAKGGAAVPCG